MNMNYVALILFGTLLLLMSLCFKKSESWISDMLLNISTGFYGSAIIYFLIERSLEKSRENEIVERRKIALTRIRFPLQELLHYLLNIYKASRVKPDVFPASYEELFNDDYFDNIRYLDFEQDAPLKPRRTWMEYSYQEVIRIKSQFDNVIDSYGSILDTETVELFENISNCQIFHLFSYFPAILESDRQHGFQRPYLMLNGPHELLRKDIPNIIALLKKVNDTVSRPLVLQQEYFRDDQAPRWGVNRTHLQLE